MPTTPCASCLLTLHHIDRQQRHTLGEIQRRLKPGGRLVVAHHTAADPEPQHWITRSVAFGDRAGANWARAGESARLITQRLSLPAPDAEEALLRELELRDVALFYAALSFRGWVASAR